MSEVRADSFQPYPFPERACEKAGVTDCHCGRHTQIEHRGERNKLFSYDAADVGWDGSGRKVGVPRLAHAITQSFCLGNFNFGLIAVGQSVVAEDDFGNAVPQAGVGFIVFLLRFASAMEEYDHWPLFVGMFRVFRRNRYEEVISIRSGR